MTNTEADRRVRDALLLLDCKTLDALDVPQLSMLEGHLDSLARYCASRAWVVRYGQTRKAGRAALDSMRASTQEEGSS